MARDDDELTDRIRGTGGSADKLRALFAALTKKVGPAEASRRWWAAFAPTDATDT